MKNSTIFMGLIAVPVLALFLGVGVLAMQIGEHWTDATTASLVTGLTTVCGGGFVVLSLIVAIVVGIPFAIRMFGESGRANSTWATMPPPPPRYASGLPNWQEPRPPLLEAKPEGGQWLTQGPGAYDLWEQDQDPAAQGDPYGSPLQ